MGVFPSGQWGQTVNLLLFSFGGSNPPAPTKMLSVRKYAGLFVLPDHSKSRLMSFTPAGFLLHLRIFLFPLKIAEEVGAARPVMVRLALGWMFMM